MKRNIDVLKEMAEAIQTFQYTDDELCIEVDTGEGSLIDLYKEGNGNIAKAKEQVMKLEELLHQLTEDFRDMMDYQTFDCDSFHWCCGKVRYNDFEIVNYLDTFVNMIVSLERIVNENLRVYKLLMQGVYDGGGE